MDASCRLLLRFWGVRGSMSTPHAANLGFGGNTTCLELRPTPNEVVIIDGGTGLYDLGRALMAEFQNRPLSIRFLLSHFHWDHIQGIPFFAPLFVAANEITFYSDRSPSDLQRFLEGQMVYPYFPIQFGEMPAQKRFVQTQPEMRFGDLVVRPFPVNHPQSAIGYRFERNGAIIVHSSDLEHGHETLDKTLIDYARDADVLIYDAQYTPEEYLGKRGWGHSTWMEAVRTAREANVKRLVLFHHDPSHDDSFLEKLVQEARPHFENTEAARQGCTIRV